MLKLSIRYLVNRIRFPQLSFKFTTCLKGEIKYFKNCRIGSNSQIYDIILGHDVIIENEVYLQNVVIGSNVRIYNGCNLYSVNISRYSYLSPNTVISHTKIGSFCSIGRNVHCTGANHPTDYLSTHPAFYSTKKQCGSSFANKDMFDEFLHIDIGNDVWIGSNSIILGGVKISNGAIIGAGSVVTKDVAPYSIVVGNPAKHIRFRFDEEQVKEIEAMSWWNWDDDLILQNIKKFQSSLQSHF